jgi:hypothetical protein
MNEEGPVREEMFEKNQELQSLKALMGDEGYSPEDIQQALKHGHIFHNHLMLKAIRRMQHYNEDLYTKPKMWDRWRQYVHIKKSYRYWLQFIAKRGEYIKTDIAVAFDRWRKFDTVQKETLCKLSKQELDKRMIKNGE